MDQPRLIGLRGCFASGLWERRLIGGMAAAAGFGGRGGRLPFTGLQGLALIGPVWGEWLDRGRGRVGLLGCVEGAVCDGGLYAPQELAALRSAGGRPGVSPGGRPAGNLPGGSDVELG